jgi:lysozyme
MHMSANGIADLVADEGEVLTAYRDLAGVWTIGVGLTAASGVITPKPGMKISREESRVLLAQALERNYEPTVNKVLPDVAQHVFDPSCSFHYNTGALPRASWVEKWKLGDIPAARTSFLSWNKAGGKVVPGLARRREREWYTLSTGRYHQSQGVDAAVETTLLMYGDRGEDIVGLQTLLAELGYVVSIDGIYGQETLRAVQEFQASQPDLVVDGRAGPATLTALTRVVDAQRKRLAEEEATEEVVVLPYGAELVLGT